LKANRFAEGVLSVVDVSVHFGHYYGMVVELERLQIVSVLAAKAQFIAGGSRRPESWQALV
jgi:hypothetical protein